MTSLIKSITIDHYRGFEKEQKLELTDFNNITFLVGQNNTGKSLITRLFSIFENSRYNSYLTNFSNEDFFGLITDKPIQFVFELNKDFLLLNSELSQLTKFEDVLFGCLIHKEKSKEYGRYCYLQTDNIKSHIFESNTIYSHATFKYNSAFGQRVDIKEEEAILLIEIVISVLTNSFLVFEPIRSFDKEQQNSSFKTGKELINWINNKSESDVVLKVKHKIKEYFKELNLECPDEVNTDDDNKLFVFSFNGLKLTSNEIGTGYSMLYILLMELLRNKNKHIVIIDEIESHLQPGLIRVLISILRDIGSKKDQQVQYILATHSPTVLQSAKENDFLYRFQKHSNSCTFYKFFRTKNDFSEMRKACNDLGVIPGDALLSNVVIWVEGPSEVHWLRALLKIYLPRYLSENIKSNKIKKTYNIIEGLHYSILMTGGGLISNLSFEEKEYDVTDILTETLLKVLRINPNPFVIIDFDAVDPKSKKYQRGLRIAKELNDNNKNQTGDPNTNELQTKTETEGIKNFWWLKARELENYCPPALLKQFYEKYEDSSHSKVKGWDSVTNWNVYDSAKGSGAILEERGLENVKDKSVTIKHKLQLALFLSDNLQSAHLEESKEYPNKDQLDDLTQITQ